MFSFNSNLPQCSTMSLKVVICVTLVVCLVAGQIARPGSEPGDVIGKMDAELETSNLPTKDAGVETSNIPKKDVLSETRSHHHHDKRGEGGYALPPSAKKEEIQSE